MSSVDPDAALATFPQCGVRSLSIKKCSLTCHTTRNSNFLTPSQTALEKPLLHSLIAAYPIQPASARIRLYRMVPVPAFSGAVLLERSLVSIHLPTSRGHPWRTYTVLTSSWGKVTQNISNTLCGVVPNDENYFVPFLYAFIITSSVLVFLRFISRLHKGAGLWWDDWSILASVVYSPHTLCNARC